MSGGQDLLEELLASDESSYKRCGVIRGKKRQKKLILRTPVEDEHWLDLCHKKGGKYRHPETVRKYKFCPLQVKDFSYIPNT